MVDFEYERDVTLERLLPRVRAGLSEADQAVFVPRLKAEFPRLFAGLADLYGQHYDFFYHLQQMIDVMVAAFAERSAGLRALDAQRVAQPHWYQRRGMLGYVLYVDLFNESLAGVRAKIPYLKKLGVTYLHLMPLFAAPADNSDGGYAISDFRQVNPSLGTMAELAALSDALRAEGISLVLDFVFNHTSDEHAWAQKALAGDKRYQKFYFLFPDRTLPDQYEPNLREIFPEQAPGSFTYLPQTGQWVWTTFNTFQWDLNYGNPDLFCAMLGEMLYLANQGVEVLRLDAVAFIWKKLGTSCENLPQVHTIIQAYNACARIVAPALLFKSEAIVHPDDVVSYISAGESPISYNPTYMASLWEAAATRDVGLLRYAMERRFGLPDGCAWVNYIRCHDDIGWSFADEDARALGIEGFGHRQFLNRFYTGKFEGSYARGLPFNYNEITQDMRICGSAAALAGLEQALEVRNPEWVTAAIDRIVMLHGVMIAAGGIPLIYSGDEVAQLNDYGFKADPHKANDERWVHRARFDWARLSEAERGGDAPHAQVFTRLLRLVRLRAQEPAFDGVETYFFNSGNKHVLTFARSGQLAVVANFSDFAQTVPWLALRP
ncbi:MAG: alpha-amylase family protein, partial [Anaerolineae bacterium]|nr:alpha-amylase family protein [Anaerolineae bacterium]